MFFDLRIRLLRTALRAEQYAKEALAVPEGARPQVAGPALKTLGDVSARNGKYAEAIGYYRRAEAAASDKFRPLVRISLANTYLQDKQMAQARALYQHIGQPEYGAPDPQLTATMSGFKYADTSAVVSGLALSASTGAAAGAGNHPITASNASAANYAPSYVPGVLAVDQAVLTYVADPTTQFQGAPARPIGGTVTGFAYNDTIATATSGTLAFTSAAPQRRPPAPTRCRGTGWRRPTTASSRRHRTRPR